MFRWLIVLHCLNMLAVWLRTAFQRTDFKQGSGFDQTCKKTYSVFKSHNCFETLNRKCSVLLWWEFCKFYDTTVACNIDTYGGSQSWSWISFWSWNAICSFKDQVPFILWARGLLYHVSSNPSLKHELLT